VRRPLFRGDADPRQADDEENLGQDEIGQPELALERGAAGLD
jgi:hypothetical protein